MAELDLEALGVTTGRNAVKDAKACVLILAPAKAGKTTAIATTAPRPLIINCDGIHATAGAQKINDSYEGDDYRDFLVIDGDSSSKFAKAIDVATKLVEQDAIDSVAIDSVTLLIDALKAEADAKKLEGYDIWNYVFDSFMKPWRKLKRLDVHKFLTAHITAGYEGEAGIAPSIQGSLKTKIPGSVHDIVLMDCIPGRKPNERCFIVGPQGKWTSSGRNITRSCVIEADIMVLLDELGIVKLEEKVAA